VVDLVAKSRGISVGYVSYMRENHRFINVINPATLSNAEEFSPLSSASSAISGKRPKAEGYARTAASPGTAAKPALWA
jgi:hypothetical protein